VLSARAVVIVAWISQLSCSFHFICISPRFYKLLNSSLDRLVSSHLHQRNLEAGLAHIPRLAKPCGLCRRCSATAARSQSSDHHVENSSTVPWTHHRTRSDFCVSRGRAALIQMGCFGLKSSISASTAAAPNTMPCRMSGGAPTRHGRSRSTKARCVSPKASGPHCGDSTPTRRSSGSGPMPSASTKPTTRKRARRSRRCGGYTIKRVACSPGWDCQVPERSSSWAI